MMILDGAFVNQMLSPRTLNTFQDYSNSVFLPYIFGQLQSVRRLDIVWDVYLANSLKAGTKSKQGQGHRSKVLPLAPLPSTWKSFLKNDENKSDLFCFLSKTIERNPVSRKILVSTCCDSVVSSSTDDQNHMSGCTHEETDTRVFLHAAEEGNNTNCWHWRCCTCNLCRWRNKGGRAVGCICDWKTLIFRYTAAHVIASSLSSDKSRASPAFHAVTDCDTVSFFGWNGKN